MAESGVSIEGVDFEKAYRDIERSGSIMPWDTGEPQPPIVALEEAGQIGEDVLDVGCGLGDNAIFLAGRGHRTVGVDVAPTAIRKATERARAQGVDVEFAVADATSLAGLEGRFDTVIDSALYHCLTEEARHEYIAALIRVTKPGARLHLFCHYSDHQQQGLPDVFRITEESLRETVGKGWTITRLAPAKFGTGLPPQELHRAVQAMVPDQKIDSDSLAEMTVDVFGRAQVVVWHLTAVRS